nr:PLP-dependent aminotransferase family protein [Chitinasiproducens palmae]
MTAGALKAGDRFPSVRALMRQHGVSLATATRVCHELEDAGWLEARPRSGYFVRRQRGATLPAVAEPETSALPAAAQYVGLHERISAVIAMQQRYPDAMNLGGATAAPALYPGERLQSLATKALRREPALLTAVGADHGHAAFRQAISRRALSAGFTVAPADVIVTHGAIEAVNLALRAVAQAGDTVAIESPAFFGLLQILESLGLRALEIPTSPRHGLSVEALELALASYERIAAVVVVPNLQNPLGSIMPDARKAALVALCARHGVPLIEDEPYRELADTPSLKALKAWDRDGGVIHCASFNKVLAPGLRLGWITAGRWQARVAMLKFAQSRHNETWPQIVAAEMIASGAYDRHLAQLRTRLRAQREACADAICRYFPPGTRLGTPEGGLVLWVELPTGVSSQRVFERALVEEGIRVAPGTMFSNSDRYAHCMRLSCPAPFSAAIDDALRRLGALVARLANAAAGD